LVPVVVPDHKTNSASRGQPARLVRQRIWEPSLPQQSLISGRSSAHGALTENNLYSLLKTGYTLCLKKHPRHF